MTNICVPCDSSCYSCDGPNNNECTSCDSDYFFQQGECVVQCNLNTYPDVSNRMCIDCDSSCETCFSSDSLSCFSCYNGSFLYINSCLSSCPLGFYGFNNSFCMPVEQISTTLIFSYENPFLVELDFQKNYSFINSDFLKTILSLEITGSSSVNVSYSIMVNPNNSLSYYLLLSYPNEKFQPNTYLNVYFNDSSNQSFAFINKSFSFSLKDDNFCSQNEYFDTNGNNCVSKLSIQYSLKYTNQANVILMQFNWMSAELKQSILKGLFIFEIDNMTPLIDFNYSLQITSNSVYITFLFNKSVVGGKYLNTLMNQTIYTYFNYFENTTYLINQNSSIKLMEYYLLSNQQILIMNQTASATSMGNAAISPLVYFNIFLKPNTLAPMMGILLLTIIEMLKFIEISYPPNLMTIFQTTSMDYFATPQLFTEFNSDLPPFFQYYNIKNDIINNLAESYIILFSFVTVSISIKLIFHCKPKNPIILKILNYLKQRFVWNLLVMIFFSKFMNTCFFLFICLRYELSVSFTDRETFLNFMLAMFCLIYVFLFPFHIYKTVKNLVSIREKENNPDKTPFSSSNENDNKFQVKQNVVYPMFFDSKENEKPLSSNNIKITESEEAHENEMQNNDPIILPNPIEKPIEKTIEPIVPNEKSLQSAKSLEIVENNNEETDKNQIVFFEHDMEIFKFSEKNVPMVSPQHFSTDVFLLDPQAKSIKKSIKTSLKTNTINWKEFNEYVTPMLRKEEYDSIKKQHDISLDADMTNNDNIQDKNEGSPNIYSPVNKGKISKFKELELKPIENIKIKKKALDVTPLYHPNLIKTNNDDKKIDKFNSFGQFILKISSDFIILIKNVKNTYKVEDPNEYNRKYSVLYKDFHKNQFLYNILMNIFRLFLIPAVIVSLNGLETMQISLLNFVNFMIIGYITCKPQFTTKSKIIIAYISEFCICMSYLTAFIIASLGSENLNIETRMNLGWVIVFLYILLLYFMILSILFKIVRGCGCKKKRVKIFSG